VWYASARLQVAIDGARRQGAEMSPIIMLGELVTPTAVFVGVIMIST
jgi:hypothetical protein